METPPKSNPKGAFSGYVYVSDKIPHEHRYSQWSDIVPQSDDVTHFFFPFRFPSAFPLSHTTPSNSHLPTHEVFCPQLYGLSLQMTRYLLFPSCYIEY